MDRVLRMLAGAIAATMLATAVADAAWTWTPWGGWFKPSDVPRGTPKQHFEYAMDVLKQERYAEAAQEFQRLVATYLYSKYAVEAQFMAGEAYEGAGDLYAAFEAYEALLLNYPQTERIFDALKRMYDIGDAFCGGAKKKLWGMAILPGGSTGVYVLNRLIERDPYSELAEKAVMRLGQYYMDTGQYAEAARTYARILEEYPQSEHFAEARYLKALASYKQIEGPAYDMRPMNQALDQLRDIRATAGAPEHDVPQLIENVKQIRAKSDYDTARFYLKNGKVNAARVYLESICKRYPETAYAEIARQVLSALPAEEGQGE